MGTGDSEPFDVFDRELIDPRGASSRSGMERRVTGQLLCDGSDDINAIARTVETQDEVKSKRRGALAHR
jgi:hypothetical protein